MPLDVSNAAWHMMVAQARKALIANNQWQSPKDKRPYRIKEVNNDKITIERLAEGKDTGFGPELLKNWLSEINDNGGQLSRQRFVTAVAIMSTIVNLHPALSWSEDYDTIIASDRHGINEEPPATSNYLAIPDDEGEKQKFFRKMRRGQPKFRKHLLSAYSKKCCITGCDVETVLEAAHIFDHSESGINQPENGLLLRSDVHILFDLNLIKVLPGTHTIQVAADLKDTEYAQYQGRPIAQRIDGVTISDEYLVKKAEQRLSTDEE